MTFIQGTSGKFANVNNDQQLTTDSVVRAKDNFINGESGKVWSLSFTGIDPAGSDDNFLYLKNTGSDPLRFTDLRISSTVTGIVSVRKVSGIPAYVGETAISPLSRRTGKSPTLQAIVNTDTDITGLTDEGVWFYIPLSAVGQQTHLSTSSNIIIDSGDSAVLQWSAATGILTGTISVVENGVV